ncbi:MAG: YbaB/EbfC family nucleoid-associated protein [Acutalibacteraceae bacterium]
MKARIPNAGGQNRGDMMKMIQQAQADMQNAQAEVEATEYTASVGGGAVEAVVNGAHEVKAINISPDVVDPEDVEMLSDLIIAAVNEAIKKASDAMNQKMEQAQGGLAGLTSGLGLPGLF